MPDSTRARISNFKEKFFNVYYICNAAFSGLPPSTLQRLDTIYPAYRARVEAIMNSLQKLGLPTWIVSGYRSPEEQAKTYAVGRADPGKPYSVSGITVTAPQRSEYPKWGIVSKAPPFQSAHQWGLAVDFGWLVNGSQKYEPADKGAWKALYQTAQANNAEDITAFLPSDPGHIQSKAWHFIKSNLLAYKAVYLSGGKAAVFAKLDADVAAGRVKV